MRRFLSVSGHLLLAGLLAGAAPPAPAVPGPEGPSPASVEELVQRVQAERNKAIQERLPALEALARTGTTRARDVLLALYQAEAHAADRPYLLASLTPYGGPEIRAVMIPALREGKNPVLQRTAAAWLPERMDLELTSIVLDLLAAAPDSMPAPFFRKALASTKDPAVLEWLVKAGLKSADPKRLAAVLETVAVLKPEGAFDAVARLRTSPDPAVKLAVLRALRDLDPEKSAPLLAEGLKSGHAEVAAFCLRAVGARARDDGKLRADIAKLVRSPSLEVRLAAIDALGGTGAPEAAKDLIPFLNDADWRVRAAAISALGKTRSPDAIGPLIERLARESGRLREDILPALGSLTGVQYGPNVPSWRKWWKENGEGFKVPPYDPGAAARARAGEAEDAEAASFYGIRTTSKRLAFVLDVSGSMSAAAGAAAAGAVTVVPGPAPLPAPAPAPAPEGKNRLDVAKEELARAIEPLSADAGFNLIFFSDKVRAWKERLEPAFDLSRKAALDFAKNEKPSGQTNMYDALEKAFAMPEVDTIFLLSDGVPSTGRFTTAEDILREVRRMYETRRIRIHTISIGTESRFLADVARETGGQHVVSR